MLCFLRWLVLGRHEVSQAHLCGMLYTCFFQFLACRYVFYSRGGLWKRQFGGLFRDSVRRKSIFFGWNLCICPHQSKFCCEDVSSWLNFFPYTIYIPWEWHCGFWPRLHGLRFCIHQKPQFHGQWLQNLYFIFQQPVLWRRLCFSLCFHFGSWHQRSGL
jgi:hypothetical protein